MLCAQSISTSYPRVKSKIDPLLQQAIIQKEQFPSRDLTAVESYAAGKRLSAAYGDAVGVLIKCDDDINKYVNSINGIRIGSRHGNIYTAFVPVQSVAQVAQIDKVKYIEASRILYPSLDLSVPKTGADVLHSLPDTTKRLTGKGVIIGFVDTGINTDNPNFKLPDGRTRILYVWNQYGSGTPPAGFTYGVEKDSSAINARTWISDGDHGTIVSCIAAGNGRPSMQYIGMAPEADIIMVANRTDDIWNHGLTTVGSLDGYDYIRTKASALHKRFVVNTSQGTNLGPHDGTTLYEQAVNADVAAGDIHCISAGNEGTGTRHASAVVSSSSPQVVQCNFGGSPSNGIPMDIWYEKNDRMVLRIKQTSDSNYVSLFPPVDSTIAYSLGSVDFTVTTKIGSPLNGDNEIYITFWSELSDCSLDMQFSAESGNTLPDGGRVDLWWERNYRVSFATHVDQSITLAMPACADSAITVASYNNRAGYGPVDDISSFSSHGPRRDGVLKPEIAGLGGMVTSSIGSSGYDTFSGTSLSSPHVAGAVALLLQQDSTLTNYQIRQKLFAAATADGFTGSVPNPIWGYGKLNVLKAAGYHGIPIINLSKDTISFVNPFIGLKTDDSLIVKNLGNEDLTISNVSVSNPIFSVDRPSFVVSPRSQEKLIISVTPTSIGNFSGSVTITCDDTIHPTSVIAVLGYCDYSPSASVSPDSLSFALNEQDSTSAIITISNSGAGLLYWEYGASFLFLSTTKMSFPLFGTISSGIQQVDPTTGAILRTYPLLLSGGQDGLAYDGTYLYVVTGGYYSPVYKIEALTGDIIDTIDIAQWGITSDGLATDGKILYLLSYPVFPDYLTSTIYAIDIKTEGVVGTLQPDYVIEGGITYAGRRNTIFASDYNSGIYELDKSTGAVIRSFSSPYSKNIYGVAYSNLADVLIVSGSGGQTYLLDPNTGAILSSFTGDYGGLAADEVGISSAIALQPNSGTVLPGGSQEIIVKVDARNVTAGSYHSVIALKTNDTLNETKSIPVYLTVKGPDIVSDDITAIPKEFALRQNYPNPFNPSTTIQYDLPKSAYVTLSIYNILGELVTTLIDGTRSAGTYSVQWNCQTRYGTASSGIYFAVIRAGDFRKTVKMILMK
jgi:subtilisin family serine protease